MREMIQLCHNGKNRVLFATLSIYMISKQNFSSGSMSYVSVISYVYLRKLKNTRGM